MSDINAAWGEVTDRMSALMLKLKMHAKEEMSEAELHEKVGFDKVRKAIEETMEAIGDAAKDDAVRMDAKEMGRAFVDALDTTVRSVAAKLRGQ